MLPEDVVDRIVLRERERQKKALEIRKRHEDAFRRVVPRDFSGRMGAVDGGLANFSLHGFDIVLIRSVGVIYTYDRGHLKGVEYYPHPAPMPQVLVFDLPLEEEAVPILHTLARVSSELSTARELVEKADVVLLDGSLLPSWTQKPRDGGEASRLYEQVVDLYRDLLERGTGKLIGVIKDSRGARFLRFLGEEAFSRDTAWLSYVLEEGEMTVPFPYADDPLSRPTLKDIGDIVSNVFVFYMRPSALDRPVRIEFVSKNPERDAEDIAGILLPLCSKNRSFAIPPPLVEADLRARIPKALSEDIKTRIASRLPQTLFPRREHRPF